MTVAAAAASLKIVSVSISAWMLQFKVSVAMLAWMLQFKVSMWILELRQCRHGCCSGNSVSEDVSV